MTFKVNIDILVRQRDQIGSDFYFLQLLCRFGCAFLAGIVIIKDDINFLYAAVKERKDVTSQAVNAIAGDNVMEALIIQGQSIND